MKKTIGIIVFIILIILINNTYCYASSSITYFYAEAIKIEDKNIEILSDEITIDITKSKVKNTILLKNTLSDEITTEFLIPIENKELGITVNNLSIKLNDEKMEYTKNKNGEYIIKTIIPANEGKKLEIQYNTDNDLYNAKVIKCNFDNFKGRIIGKLKVDIKIDEKNIPLIQKIYPGHYTFDDNKISVQYYNYKPTTITREVIIQKETFNNLLYGRESELTKVERKIISDWMNEKDGILKYAEEKDNDIYGMTYDILDYLKIKAGRKDVYRTDGLLYDIIIKENKKGKWEDFSTELKDNIICIEFAKTEEDNKLYIKNLETEGEEGNEHEVEKIKQKSEIEILKTSYGWTERKGAKVIYVGQGINGEDLNASKEEIVEYVNSVNADMFIRIEIYDRKLSEKDFNDGYVVEKQYGYVRYYKNKNYNENTDECYYKMIRIGEGMVGYYDDKNYEIAKAFTLDKKKKELESKKSYEANMQDEFSLYFSDYDDYKKNYYNLYLKESMIKLPNEYISNNSKVPTVIQFVGNRIEENGKYIVQFFEDSGIYNGSARGIVTVKNAIETDSAKKMISQNRENNKKISNNVNKKIKKLKITNNEKQMQEELKRREEEKDKKNVQNEETPADKKITNYNNKDMIVFGVIGMGIIICLVILTIRHKNKIKEM